MHEPSLRRSGAIVTLALALLLALAGCKSSVEAQTARYQRVRDSLSAFATRNPVVKADVEAKLAEFDQQFQAASAKGGDDAISAIAAVAARMEAYEKEINPEKRAAQADATGSPPTGSKLGTPPPGTAPAVQPVTPTAPGSKVGAPVPPQPAPQGGSGFGGAAPAQPVPAQPAPQGGSGFGGAAPTQPVPAPAPTQPAPQGGSGFGGQ